MNRLIPEGASAETCETSAGALRVLRSGAPDEQHLPVVFVHGGGSDNAGISWFSALGSTGERRECIAIDLPGFGGSIDSAAVGGAAALADVVDEAARRSGFTRYAAVGVSMGGDVVLNLALRHPERVAGIVLVAPGGLISRFGGAIRHRLVWMSTRLPDAVLTPLARFANRFSRSALSAIVKRPDSLPAELVDEYVREASNRNAGLAFGRYNRASIGPTRMLNDLSERVAEIAIPALFFHGDSDPMVPLEGSRKASTKMSDAELVVAPDCGHWAQLEKPELFRTVLEGFLDRLDAEPRTLG